MAEVLTDNDDIIDEADINVVDLPQPEALPAADPKPEAQQPTQDDDDDEEDARLGDSEEDDGLTEKQRKRREERRARNEKSKQARLRTEAELQELRALVPSLMQRLQTIEGAHTTSTQTALQQQLSQAEQDAQLALELHAQAIDSGNGAEATRALAIREQALARANELRPMVQAAPTPQTQGPDPEVQRLATQWVSQNAWFKPEGSDPASMLTRAIDKQVAADGFNPGTQAYWQEVTRRVTTALDEAGLLGQQRKAPAAQDPLPTGMGREHAPASTKQKVNLSAERVQAIKDAGKWDDPVARTKMVKAFQTYDREHGLLKN